MRVLVLGSGVIGVTSAYYLARAGFDVVVVDRQPAAAMETSFANAGQVSPGYASPWAAPGVPLKAIKWLLQRHAPLAIKATADIDQYLWMAQMLRNCTASRYAVNKEPLAGNSVEAVANALRAVAAQDSILIISADAAAPVQAAVTVMDAARRVGLTQITFAARTGASP